MKQILLNRLQLDNAGTRYFHPGIAIKADADATAGEHAAQSTEAGTEFIVGDTGVIRNLYVKLSAAPTAGKSWTLTVRKNGVDQTVVATVADAATTGNSSSNSFNVAAGDLITISQVSSGTPSNAVAQISLEVEGTTTGRSVIYGGYRSYAANAYVPIGGYYSLASDETTGNENKTYVLAPHAFTIKAIYVKLAVDPGGSASRELEVYGGTFGSGVLLTGAEVTIAAGSTTGNVTGLNLAVAQGDLLQLHTVVASGPAASKVMYSIVVDASLDGNSWMTVGNGQKSTFDGYRPFNSTTLNVNSGDVADDVIVGPTSFQLKNLHIQYDVFFNAADSVVYTLQKNGSNEALAVTIASSTRDGWDRTNVVTVSENDDININVNHTGTGTSSGLDEVVSMTMFVPPATPKGMTTLFGM